jgi:hypothetical protein
MNANTRSAPVSPIPAPAYADLFEIVARSGPDAQVSIATDRSIDVYTLGASITSLLRHTVQEPYSVTAQCTAESRSGIEYGNWSALGVLYLCE